MGRISMLWMSHTDPASGGIHRAMFDGFRADLLELTVSILVLDLHHYTGEERGGHLISFTSHML
jgi:hypothetical protein